MKKVNFLFSALFGVVTKDLYKVFFEVRKDDSKMKFYIFYFKKAVQSGTAPQRLNMLFEKTENL